MNKVTLIGNLVRDNEIILLGLRRKNFYKGNILQYNKFIKEQCSL